MFEHAERADTGVPAFLNVGHSVTDLDDRLHGRHLKFPHIGKNHIRVRAAQTVHRIRAEPCIRCIPLLCRVFGDNCHHFVGITGRDADFQTHFTQLRCGFYDTRLRRRILLQTAHERVLKRAVDGFDCRFVRLCAVFFRSTGTPARTRPPVQSSRNRPPCLPNNA